MTHRLDQITDPLEILGYVGAFDRDLAEYGAEFFSASDYVAYARAADRLEATHPDDARAMRVTLQTLLNDGTNGLTWKVREALRCALFPSYRADHEWYEERQRLIATASGPITMDAAHISQLYQAVKTARAFANVYHINHNAKLESSLAACETLLLHHARQQMQVGDVG